MQGVSVRDRHGSRSVRTPGRYRLRVVVWGSVKQIRCMDFWDQAITATNCFARGGLCVSGEARSSEGRRVSALLCARPALTEREGNALRKLLHEACAIWPRGVPIGFVLGAQLYPRIGKARTGKVVSACKGVLEWFVLAALMTIELQLAHCYAYTSYQFCFH